MLSKMVPILSKSGRGIATYSRSPLIHPGQPVRSPGRSSYPSGKEKVDSRALQKLLNSMDLSIQQLLNSGNHGLGKDLDRLQIAAGILCLDP